MPTFQYQAVLLHQLPGGQGWQIIVVRQNQVRELIVVLAPNTGVVG
jgi:hypothetical protein